MVRKIQRDSVSGKIIRDSVSGKIQTFVNSEAASCVLCTSTQPAFIDITLSGLVDCSGCYALGTFGGGGFYANITSAISGSVNGNTYRVTQTDPFLTCRWEGSFAGSFGEAKIYSNSDCSTLFRTDTYDTILVFLDYASATTYTLHVFLGDAGVGFGTVFSQTGSIASNDCFDLDGDILSSGFGCNDGIMVVCHSSQAIITL